MTDTLDGVTLPLADEEGNVLPENSCPECAAEGNPQTFKSIGGLASHRSKRHGIAGKGDHKKGQGKTSINLNVNSSKSSKPTKEAEKLAKTAQGATSFANMVAAGCAFIGQPEDGTIVAANAEAFGAAIGELAQYQPWLSSIFAPGGEMTGEVAAWLGLLAVTAGIVVPIGARHGWIPERYAAAFGVAVAETAKVADNGARAA